MTTIEVLAHSLLLIVTATGLYELMRQAQLRRPSRVPAWVRHNHTPTNPPEPAIRIYQMSPTTRQAIIESMNDGMLVLDNRNRIIDINPAAKEIIHSSMANVVGKPIEKVWPTLAAHFRAAQTKPVDIALGTKEAKRFYEISVSPFFDGNQEQRGHLLVFRDVTERKRMENIRDNMTRTMVHDLRDPISNSLFALEMLRATLVESGSPDAQQLLELTFASTAKTLQLVDKILEIGRLESGEFPLSLTAISLTELADTVLEAQSLRAENKAIQLVNEVPPSLPPIWADLDLLERVLQNLVDNSLKFTPDGGTIRIKARESTSQPEGDEEDLLLLVSVSDTGPGIPASMQDQIFEQFVTGTHTECGSGLGLAFCKMALAAHDQNIWTETQPQEGTTVTFSLPVFDLNA